MAKLLKGYGVIKEIESDLKVRVDKLKLASIQPVLAIVRIGEKEEDLTYERSAIKRCENVGIEVRCFSLDEDTDTDTLLNFIERLNFAEDIHGILMFRPLPDYIDENIVISAISPEKDVDGCTPLSLYKVFAGDTSGFAPCTPEAVVTMLEYYEIPIEGQKIVLVGRSMVVGRPLSMLLLKKNATIKICHTRTKNIQAETKDADILIVAAGKTEIIDGSYVSENMTVIDVGINVNDEGKLTGDVNFDIVEPIVKAISPVPKGVGGVTTAVLARHVVEAAEAFMAKNI